MNRNTANKSGSPRKKRPTAVIANNNSSDTEGQNSSNSPIKRERKILRFPTLAERRAKKEEERKVAKPTWKLG